MQDFADLWALEWSPCVASPRLVPKNAVLMKVFAVCLKGCHTMTGLGDASVAHQCRAWKTNGLDSWQACGSFGIPRDGLAPVLVKETQCSNQTTDTTNIWDAGDRNTPVTIVQRSFFLFLPGDLQHGWLSTITKQSTQIHFCFCFLTHLWVNHLKLALFGRIYSLLVEPSSIHYGSTFWYFVEHTTVSSLLVYTIGYNHICLKMPLI